MLRFAVQLASGKTLKIVGRRPSDQEAAVLRDGQQGRGCAVLAEHVVAWSHQDSDGWPVPSDLKAMSRLSPEDFKAVVAALTKPPEPAKETPKPPSAVAPIAKPAEPQPPEPPPAAAPK